MKRLPDLIIGSIYTRWTVIDRAPPETKGNKWLCRCECGTIKVIKAEQLNGGHSRSCGCLSIDTARALMKVRSKTHGMSRAKIYKAWLKLVRRCTKPQDADFSEYGARGITVCDEWLKFENFYRDMGERPTAHHSIERIDNTKGYTPDNCRWATAIEQANNRRNTRLYTINGRAMTIPMWAREYGVSVRLVAGRIYRLKWPIEKALTEPKILPTHPKRPPAN
jgi:hypothetical protein